MTRAIILTVEVESESELMLLADEILEATQNLGVTDAKPWSPHGGVIPPLAGGLVQPPITTKTKPQ